MSCTSSSSTGAFERPQQQLQYQRSPFDLPLKLYESYQENGTKYLKITKKPPPELEARLSACEGEIFLNGIPPEVSAERIATVAAQIGEVYLLRFKVNFSGESRGFAYMQYLDPFLMHLAVMRLPFMFREHNMPTIRVRKSRNSSRLLLKRTYRMTPQTVYDTLKDITQFSKLICREVYPGCYEYQIVYKCNEEAVHARRELLKCITSFGRSAIVVWDTTSDGGERSSSAQRVNGGGGNMSGCSLPSRPTQRRGSFSRSSTIEMPFIANWTANGLPNPGSLATMPVSATPTSQAMNSRVDEMQQLSDTFASIWQNPLMLRNSRFDLEGAVKTSADLFYELQQQQQRQQQQQQ